MAHKEFFLVQFFIYFSSAKHIYFCPVFPQPENIMLSDKKAPNPDIKIIDFGMAHCFIQGEEYKSMGGTPQYIGKWCSPVNKTEKNNQCLMLKGVSVYSLMLSESTSDFLYLQYRAGFPGPLVSMETNESSGSDMALLVRVRNEWTEKGTEMAFRSIASDVKACCVIFTARAFELHATDRGTHTHTHPLAVSVH